MHTLFGDPAMTLQEIRSSLLAWARRASARWS
jgi:hypothetical protein